MDINFLIEILKENLISNLDYNMTYISMLFILSYYASTIFKHFLKRLDIGFFGRFALFYIFLIFGTNPVFVYLTNTVLSISDFNLKWIVISCLLIWSFVKFDEDIAKIGKR
jgi:hypothetical protein